MYFILLISNKLTGPYKKKYNYCFWHITTRLSRNCVCLLQTLKKLILLTVKMAKCQFLEYVTRTQKRYLQAARLSNEEAREN